MKVQEEQTFGFGDMVAMKFGIWYAAHIRGIMGQSDLDRKAKPDFEIRRVRFSSIATGFATAGHKDAQRWQRDTHSPQAAASPNHGISILNMHLKDV